MRRMMWPAGEWRKVIADDKPFYAVRRVFAFWRWRGQVVRETALDAPIHNPRHAEIVCMAMNIEKPDRYYVGEFYDEQSVIEALDNLAEAA